MARHRYFRKQHLTVAQQVYFMRIRFPQFRSTTNRGQWVRWVGTLQPTALSKVYTIDITYRVPARPEIRVLSPQLERRPESSGLPHVFEEDDLCLHQAHEWRGDLVIADTLVPWIVAWLYFYEVWFATGYWLGEGTHPGRREHRAIA